MIPKIIHYCWFGGKPIPKKYLLYIKGWEKIMPDFQIIRWDENNAPMNIPYMQTALANRKWANLSNYTRLHALYLHGGVYFDVDIEAMRPLDNQLSDNCFLGFEDRFVNWDGCINNAVMGAVPKHWFVKEMMDTLLGTFDGKEEAHLSSPNTTTAILKKHGLQEYGDQYLKDIHLYPTEYFYPYSWHNYFRPEQVTKNTRTIHWFQGSWQKKQQKIQISLLIRKQYHLLRWQFLKWKHQ